MLVSTVLRAGGYNVFDFHPRDMYGNIHGEGTYAIHA